MEHSKFATQNHLLTWNIASTAQLKAFRQEKNVVSVFQIISDNCRSFTKVFRKMQTCFS